MARSDFLHKDFKKAVRQFDEGQWLQMLNDRNLSVHSYDYEYV